MTRKGTGAAVKVRWNGKEYPGDVEPNAGEIRRVERILGEEIDTWSRLTQSMVAVFVAVRRVDPDALTWEDLEASPVDALLDCLVEEKAARKVPLDRKPAAAKAAAGRSAPRKRPSTRRAAAGSSTTGSTSTGAS